MNLRRMLGRETDHEWWVRWSREHRWDQLADYNARVAKGIVHTPQYAERMRREQEAWRREQETGIPAPLIDWRSGM